MNEEQLYKRAFGEMQTLLTRSESDVALVKAQAEFYLEEYNNLQEEHNNLQEEHNNLQEEHKKLIKEKEELTEDLRKLEGEPDPHKTEENK